MEAKKNQALAAPRPAARPRGRPVLREHSEVREARDRAIVRRGQDRARVELFFMLAIV